MATTVSPKYEDDFMLRALTKELEREVQNVMEETILPNIKKIIKKSAANAVKKWSIRYQQDAHNSFETTYQIAFVEEVVKTVMQDNPIKIEIMKDK